MRDEVPLTSFWQAFAPQELVELEAEEVDDEDESPVLSLEPGGERPTIRVGIVISIAVSNTPAAASGARGPSLMIFATS